ncbi:MAG: transposase [Candidatus Rifleibacteriota bacterium]
MNKIPRRRYTKEFRSEAVQMVEKDGLSGYEVARRLSLPKSTIDNWVRAFRKGKLGEIGQNIRPQTELEAENARLRRELAETRMERDILKKAAAYFAKGSLPNTR